MRELLTDIDGALGGGLNEEIVPRVFISHGSEDKERFVLGFAEGLREAGIDAWLDKWEIAPGDSLVQRIFSDGIGGADAFIIVLSSTSVEKPWIKAELDVGVVRNIEENTRLIVIRLDGVEVPTALRAKKWVTIGDLSSYEDELQEVVNAIFGNQTRPPLGSAPTYASLPSFTGLNSPDSAVLRILVEGAIEADVDFAMSSGLLERAASGATHACVPGRSGRSIKFGFKRLGAFPRTHETLTNSCLENSQRIQNTGVRKRI